MVSTKDAYNTVLLPIDSTSTIMYKSEMNKNKCYTASEGLWFTFCFVCWLHVACNSLMGVQEDQYCRFYLVQPSGQLIGSPLQCSRSNSVPFCQHKIDVTVCVLRYDTFCTRHQLDRAPSVFYLGLFGLRALRTQSENILTQTTHVRRSHKRGIDWPV